MASEPPLWPSYKSLWCKLKRRCLVPRFVLLLGLLLAPIALTPALCVVAYLLRDQGWGWLVTVTSGLWLVIQGCFLLLLLLLQILRRKFKQMQTLPQTASTLLSPFSSLIIIGALFLGRVDVAIYVSYGWGTVAAFTQWRKKGILASVVTASINGLLLAAFVAGSLWLVLLLLSLQITWQFSKTPWTALPNELRKKPSQREFMTKAREACVAGGG